MSDTALAALLLTNRICDIGVQPLTPGEFWSLVARVPDLSVLLGASATRVAEITREDEAASQRVAELLAAASEFVMARERLTDEGIQVLSAVDDRFPRRLVERLGAACPSFLTVTGPIDWLKLGGLGVVGSRDATREACDIARAAARVAGAAGRPVISGLARGIDQESMSAALGAGGAVIGIPAEGLRRASKSPEVRRRVHAGELCIASPYAPWMGFTAGNAMGRNKVVYGLADATFVVCADHRKGGTWEGAKEALRRDFGPVAVWRGHGEGPGNAGLLALGGHPVTAIENVLDAPDPATPRDDQGSLF